MAHRAELWMSISGAKERLEAEPEIYEDLLKRIEADEGIVEKEVVDQIEKDLPRTMPDNILFKKDQESF